MLIKICGIKNIETAKAAVEAGADFLGFIFVPDTKRFIEPDEAKKIIEQIPEKIGKVGVFQNQTADQVNKIAGDLKLDFVQLHGIETPEYIKQVSAKVIKAFNLAADFGSEQVGLMLGQYNASY